MVVVAPPKQIFLSYAHLDGETFTNALRHRLIDEYGFSVWQDTTDLEGGQDWWQQIEYAVKHANSMVLVVTQGSLDSKEVRKELQLARQEGIRIVPVLGDPKLDLKQVPRWLSYLHVVNLENPEQRAGFIRTLNKPYEKKRVPFMAEELSTDFVQRPGEFEDIISRLIDKEQRYPVAITAALRGAGGYGKTMLACAVCHDKRIQEAFKHGILWVTLGETPGDLVKKIDDLIYILSGEQTHINSIEAAVARFREVLADRDILLVIDDVWSESHLKPFLQGGERCARLITTRNSDTLPPEAQKINVDSMLPNEAVALLTKELPQTKNFGVVTAMAKRLFEWPLLLKLVNSVLRDRIAEHNQPLSEALAYVEKALAQDGLTAFDNPGDHEAREKAVRATLRVSLNRLKTPERVRYGELVIFPEDTDIPLVTLEKLWGATGDFTSARTERFCERLDSLSLLRSFDPVLRSIRLHDVVRAYLLSENLITWETTHNQLLHAYKIKRWADLPPKEPYLWDWLAHHLLGAGRGDELVSTVKDLNYLTAKTHVRSAYAAEADLVAAEKYAPNDASLRVLRRNFANAGHLLNASRTLKDIRITLHSRLQHLPELADLCRALENNLIRPYLTAFHALPDLPRPGLIRTLSEHAAVKCCAISGDGDFIVSASADRTLKIWDARTGAERVTLRGHRAEVSGCAVVTSGPAGSYVVSASADKTLRVWNALTGAEVLKFDGHKAWVRAVAVSPKGNLMVSASDDKTLKIWDVKDGVERMMLEGHTGGVQDCAWSLKHNFIVSASEDKTLKVWDAQTGAERFTLTGHKGCVHSCAISPAGDFIVSASDDRTLKVWDAQTGAERFTLTGHKAGVYGCAVSATGDVIVSASDDRTIKTWDAKTGAERTTLTGHTGMASGCSVSLAGDFIVSASDDKTLKIWDMHADTERQPTRGHSATVRDCAISPAGNLVVSASDDQTLKIWDIRTGAECLTLAGHSAWARACAVSPAGDFIVSASDDKLLKVWDTQSGAERFTLKGHTGWVEDCAVSPAGDFIVSASNDKTLKIWDARSGAERLTLTGHNDWVNSCAIGPGGKFILSASRDKTLKIWDTESGIERCTLPGHTAAVRTCAVSPHGDFAVSASQNGELRVWDLDACEVRLVLEGHHDAVTGCAISPGSDLIFSASADNTLRMWDTQTGKCLATLHVDGALMSCAVHPDGKHVIATGDRGVYFLRLVRA